jgi:hypothetical protein
VGSNPARGIDVCVSLLCFPVYAEVFAKGYHSSKEVLLPNVLTRFRNVPRDAAKDCRATYDDDDDDDDDDDWLQILYFKSEVFNQRPSRMFLTSSGAIFLLVKKMKVQKRNRKNICYILIYSILSALRHKTFVPFYC